MKKYLSGCTAFVVWFLVTACKEQDQLFLKLDLKESQITFENKLSPTEDFNIIDYLYFYNGGGIAVGDINGDQLPDLFFSGNQVRNQLYLNKGNLKFEDITEKAGVAGNSTWNTGAVMGDVNGDGLLDIYVCAVVGLKHLTGHNELYINNGDNTFSEKAADYGLDFDTYSSSAAFLDYDLDNDLDIYLLNHAVHTPGSFGHARLRNTRSYESGDKLLRNDGGKFVDVSEQAKIFGGVIGYGLGVAVSDFNMDGYPDIFVGNDFHEDDYLYINNRDGTFSERGRQAFTITSKFSMGNDAADINHDGYPDLITLDMLPEDETVLKRSEGDDNIDLLRMRTKEYGYGYQFIRNMMQINLGNGKFAETALLGNIAATDWSWSAIFTDFDQDGHPDLFISNGIPRRPNDLDYMKYVSSEQIVTTMGSTKLVDAKALSLMPSGIARNCIFKGSGTYVFEDRTNAWLPDEKNCSTATALADLDNDGDMDIVINNVDDKPSIYINQNNADGGYIKIRLKYTEQNPFGIGTQVYSYDGGILQFKELYTVRGFQASSEPVIHFGYGRTQQVDSIIVVWPNGKRQRLTGVKTNQTLEVVFDNDRQAVKAPITEARTHVFEKIDPEELRLAFRHREDHYTDFSRQKLLPYQQSDRGPATAVGDINNDGLSDIYFGGSKYIAGQLYIQSKNGFIKSGLSDILTDSVKEDVEAVIDDFDDDGRADLFIATGGADFYGKAKPLLDSYYRSGDSGFSVEQVSNYYENASCIEKCDFDNDGDIDLFVGNESVSNDFGKLPRSYLLRNDDGKFVPVQTDIFEKIGMVTDAAWDDYNLDGQMDLIVVGEWMQPVFLRNDRGSFKKESVVNEPLSGLWQSICSFDIDNDGDRDYILGNWGLNSKFKASDEHPMKMYYGDIDKNGQTETIVAIEKQGKYYPFEGFDLIASQIAGLKKKFTSYSSFAGKTMDEIFSIEEVEGVVIYKVNELATGILRNDNGKFIFARLPVETQLAPVMAQLAYDFDGDGKQEILLGGNYFGVQPFHGRFGSFPGALVDSNGGVISGALIGLDLINQSVRHFNIITVDGIKYLLVTINDAEAQLYKLVR